MEDKPSSGGTSPVEVKECIEKGLKFILLSHLNRTLEFDLSISNYFCSYLLQHHPHHPISDCLSFQKLEASNGNIVLPHPLYVHLASILYEYITSGALCEASNNMASFDEDNDLKARGNWIQLVLDEGINLLNILKTINFELHVQEPFFTQLKDGLKTVEGRCAIGDYNRIGSGASILFNKCLVLQVEDIHRYASFSEMLEAESLARVLPGVTTIDEGVAVYRKFYTEEKERENGVLAIHVAKSAAQPYIPLARILSGLSDKGLECLFNLLHLPGTMPDK